MNNQNKGKRKMAKIEKQDNRNEKKVNELKSKYTSLFTFMIKAQLLTIIKDVFNLDF